MIKKWLEFHFVSNIIKINRLVMSWMSTLVSIPFPTYHGLIALYLACLTHNPRVHGSRPPPATANLIS